MTRDQYLAMCVIGGIALTAFIEVMRLRAQIGGAQPLPIPQTARAVI